MVCDMAETYQIFNYRGLSVQALATLVLGLRDNSRVKLKLAGMTVDTDTLLLAAAVDQLAFLSWTKTKDAQRGNNKPRSIASSLLHAAEKRKSDMVSFDTAADFDAFRNRILGGK